MQALLMYAYGLQLLTLTLGINQHQEPQHICKPIPGDSNWPSRLEWRNLDFSLQGRLISPPPPGAVCHPTQATFNPIACPVVAAQWQLNSFHISNPISNNLNNWNNDSCLPVPAYPCSGDGYPRYVINATSVKDVQEGVKFAKKTGVRLIVKGTGHDYLGRYALLTSSR